MDGAARVIRRKRPEGNTARAPVGQCGNISRQYAPSRKWMDSSDVRPPPSAPSERQQPTRRSRPAAPFRGRHRPLFPLPRFPPHREKDRRRATTDERPDIQSGCGGPRAITAIRTAHHAPERHDHRGMWPTRCSLVGLGGSLTVPRGRPILRFNRFHDGRTLPHAFRERPRGACLRQSGDFLRSDVP
jgi:hypothetical protein